MLQNSFPVLDYVLCPYELAEQEMFHLEVDPGGGGKLRRKSLDVLRTSVVICFSSRGWGSGRVQNFDYFGFRHHSSAFSKWVLLSFKLLTII